MAVQYPGHLMRTRWQAAWLCVVLAVILFPLAAWRALTQPPAAAIALLALTAAPFIGAFQTWRFLGSQEGMHHEPTPAMVFAFRFLANTPLTFGALLFILLMALN